MNCWTMLSHSNGFGLAGFIEQLLAVPHLRPVSLSDPTKMVWKNILVFTSAHGYVGADGTPPTHTISEGAWLEMTINNPSSPAGPHPHPSPYAYPNNRSLPLPNYGYDAAFQDGIFRGTGTMAGIEIGLSNELANYWQETIGFIGMCAPGSLFLRYDEGIGAEAIFGSPTPTPDYNLNLDEGYFNWYTPEDTFDFAPSSGRLYSRWLQKCIAAKAADSTMDIRLVVLWMGDNDSNRARERVLNFEDHARKFIKRIRQDLVDNNLTTLPADQVRIVWPGVLDFYDGIVVGTPQGNPDFCNAALQRIAADDPYLRFLDVNSYETWDDDPGHFTSAAYAQIYQDVFELFLEMEVEPYAALDEDDRLTVTQVYDRVRRYYTRGKVNTDVSDDLILMHLNGSMHHCLHQCGDMAYWLRHRRPVSVTGGGVNNPITLPKDVHRLLKIEHIGDVTYPISFEMLGHVDGGRLQIAMPRYTTGTYTMHYIRMPRDLTREQEKVPFPTMLVEWVVVETCYRLARAASNPLQMASFQAEVVRLREDVLKNLAQTQRAKKDRIHTQRRLPNVLRRNRINRQWDN